MDYNSRLLTHRMETFLNFSFKLLSLTLVAFFNKFVAKTSLERRLCSSYNYFESEIRFGIVEAKGCTSHKTKFQIS